uniref:Reverse transcriptase Ty1/copia-type domain-containing protein n=1 Tax=Ananas comosus var. bracteatus TaxID=296719 RepID=A0A6V7P8U6_ANACO|nr:unnamed protein product [Ananas comosus var. bracteatus]
MTLRSMTGSLKPKVIQSLITSHTLAIPLEPHCYTEAVKDPNWMQAMSVEYNALLDNATWILVPPDRAQNLIGCKWVYKIKQKADGSIERYKARLVAQGFKQQEGVDYS